MTKPQLINSSILHRCLGDDPETCFCMYDPECTGRFNGRMVKVPFWLDVLLRPRHTWRVLEARRKLKGAR